MIDDTKPAPKSAENSIQIRTHFDLDNKEIDRGKHHLQNFIWKRKGDLKLISIIFNKDYSL